MTRIPGSPVTQEDALEYIDVSTYKERTTTTSKIASTEAKGKPVSGRDRTGMLLPQRALARG